MHVVAGAARAAQPAGDERVHDDRVADLDVGHARADLVDPARVLVPGRVRQLDARTSRPTGPPGCAGRCGTAPPRRCARSRRAARSTFGSSTSSSFSGSWYACRRAAFMPPPPLGRDSRIGRAAASGTCPPLVSRLRLTSRARRSHVGRLVGAQRGCRRRATQRGVAGAAGMPELAAQLQAAPGVGARRAARRRAAPRSPAPSAVAQQGLAHARLARDQRLAPEQLAQRVQRALGLAREGVGEARRRAPAQR